ncbi:hypothetical protein Taro_020113 [Colocasia esculenta]|uniref:Myb/SANT-like domain-containing protein n=1 Tax=Colocasia esculenta TaxID=4460 RepID=A0A843UY13_COLES|nr:hypothetical protein [Colocasia esculenta]
MYPTQERRKEDDEQASTAKPSASTASSSSSNSVYLRWIPYPTSTQGIAAASAMWPTSPPTLPITLPEAIPSYLSKGSLLAPPPSSLSAASDQNPPSGNTRDENPPSFSPADFWKQCWTTIAKLYNAAVGENSTSIQVKERFKSLKRKFALYEELLKLSGWGWDPETQTPIPGYEGAWDEALRAINENVDAEDDDVPIAMNINATAVAARRAIREAIADQLWAVGNAY